MSKSNRLKQSNRTPMVPRQPEHAFTLIELLVVLAMVTLLAMTLLPALAKAKYPSMVSNCAANFRQWVEMANVYASDDAQGSMPSFPVLDSGGNPTDVATNFIFNLIPYGMTMTMNFCPVRPQDWDVANAQFHAVMHRYMQNIADLNYWFSAVGLRSVNGGYSKLIHLWWVPRPTTLSGYGLPVPIPGHPTPGSLFPWPGYPVGNAPAGALPWPLKTSDASVSKQPIISDYTECGSTVDINQIPPPVTGKLGYAHFYNGSLQSVNVGYADGHVDLHIRAAMAWQYTGNNGNNTYYY
jgi:prepilin-type N-terminal cleavage/methylation domain-containing protein/prepilin-type processing-associated H-X9-DG protein